MNIKINEILLLLEQVKYNRDDDIFLKISDSRKISLVFECNFCEHEFPIMELNREKDFILCKNCFSKNNILDVYTSHFTEGRPVSDGKLFDSD